MSKLVEVTVEGGRLVMHLNCNHTKESIKFDPFPSLSLTYFLMNEIGREEHCPICDIKVYYCRSCKVVNYIEVVPNEFIGDTLIRLHRDHMKISPQCTTSTREIEILDAKTCPSLEALESIPNTPNWAIESIATFLSFNYKKGRKA